MPMYGPASCICLVSLFLLSSNQATNAAVKFQDARSLNGGEDPVALLTSDLNGDAKPDLIAVNGGYGDGSGLSVLLNRGAAHFSLSKYPVPKNPITVAVADFNHDGFGDIAVTDSEGVSILLGMPNGKFSAAQTYVATPPNQPLTPLPNGLAIGDFNGDGLLDLVVTDTQNSTVNFLNGDGKGAFALKSSITQYMPTAVAVGDFNNDGHLDVAVDCSIGGLIDVYIGHGDGTFGAAVDYFTSAGPRTVEVADVNGDGRIDLLVPDVLGLEILLGNADGTFQQPYSYAAPFGVGLAIADFNADGKPDVVLTTSAGINFVPGNGSGQFGMAVSYATGSWPGSAALADFDGDGKIDAVVPNSASNNLGLYLGKGNGTFVGATLYAITGAVAMIVGDVNGDQIPDVLIDEGGTISIYFGRKGGLLNPIPEKVKIGGAYSGPIALGDLNNDISGTYSGPIALGDLNNDGKLDLVIADGASSVYLALGNGDGTFGTPTVYASGLLSASAVLIGDFNHDDRHDLAVAGYNAVTIVFGGGGGTFQRPTTSYVGFVPMWITSGDFNGDGNLDLVTSNSGSGTFSVLLGKGDGRFRAAEDYPVDYAGDLISVDLNHDGILDLVIAGQSSLAIFLGNGNGTFHPGKSIPAQASQVAALDVNGDGNIDLAFTMLGGVSISMGNGDGTFQEPLSFLAGSIPNCLNVADFDRDGKPDVVVTGASGFAGGAQSLTILLNRTTQ